MKLNQNKPKTDSETVVLMTHFQPPFQIVTLFSRLDSSPATACVTFINVWLNYVSTPNVSCASFMCLIPPLDVQDRLFLAEAKTARWRWSAESQGRLRAPCQAPSLGDWCPPRPLCRALAGPVGRGCRELASLGRRLMDTEVARPMSEEDDQLHSSPAAAGIAEEFQLVRWQSAAVPKETATTSSAQCSVTATKSSVVTPLTTPGVKVATWRPLSSLHGLI